MLLERSGLSLDIETVRLNAMPGQERRSEMINMKIQGFSAWPCRKTLDGSRRKLRALYKNKRLVPGVNPVGSWSSPRTDQRRLWRKARTRLKSAELFRENIHAQPLFSQFAISITAAIACSSSWAGIVSVFGEQAVWSRNPSALTMRKNALR